MLTVADALRLDVFSSARLLAGASGLGHPIQWVHIIDVPEYGPWVDGGVLMLTTAYGLKDDPASQADLILALTEKGVVGLVVGLTEYLQSLPPEMVASAERLGFPLIVVPYGIRFIDITKAVLDRILYEQNHLLKQTTKIHETLTRLVLEGQGFAELAQALASLLKRTVVYEDATFRILGYSSLDQPVDAARLQSIAEARTPPAVVAKLRECGLFERLREAGGQPVRVPPIPELGMTMERVAAAIVVGRETFGYVWIISGDRSFEDLDLVAIEHAATVAALIMLKGKEVRAAEQRLRGGFVDRLLGAAPDDLPAIVHEAERFGLDPGRSHQAILLSLMTLPPVPQIDLADRLDHVIRQHPRSALVALRNDQVLVLCEADGIRDNEALIHRLLEALHDLDVTARAGVGRPSASLVDLSLSYRQAEDTLQVGRSLLPHRPVLVFDDLGFLHWLHRLPKEVVPQNAFFQKIEALASAEKAAHKDLLLTLEEYLDSGGCAKETARKLFIHRNTLSHRLERIRALCGVDLDDPFVRLNLQVALKRYRLLSPRSG